MKKYLTVLSFLTPVLLFSMTGGSALAVQKKVDLIIPGCIA